MKHLLDACSKQWIDDADLRSGIRFSADCESDKKMVGPNSLLLYWYSIQFEQDKN